MRSPCKPLLALGLLLSSGAHAGGSTGGGNVVVDPNGKVSFLDLMKVPTREIFDPRLTPGGKDLLDTLKRISAFGQTTLIPANFQRLTASTGTAVLDDLDSLTFYTVPGPLPELNDKGLVLFKRDFDGVVRRLAVQSIEKRTVLVDRELFRQLSESPVDVAAFYLHEALIRAYYDGEIWKPLQSTEQIGNFVHIVFDPDTSDQITPRILARYLNDTGIPVAPGRYFGYAQKKGMNSPRISFQDFLTFDRQDQKVRFYSGHGAGYIPQACNDNCTLWIAHVTEHADGRNWDAQLVMNTELPYDSFNLLEIYDSGTHYDHTLSGWRDDSVIFLEKPELDSSNRPLE